jgi:hypothetical protein
MGILFGVLLFLVLGIPSIVILAVIFGELIAPGSFVSVELIAPNRDRDGGV